MKVNDKDDIPYMKWKIKVMFETPNQYIVASGFLLGMTNLMYFSPDLWISDDIWIYIEHPMKCSVVKHRPRCANATEAPRAAQVPKTWMAIFMAMFMGILWVFYGNFCGFFSWNFCRDFMAISVGFCGDIMIIMGLSRMLAAI